MNESVMNATQLRNLQERIEQLEEEVRDFKDSNQKYLRYIQQLVSTARTQDIEMTKLRKDQ